MIRALYLAALLAAVLPAARAADNAGFCKSMCGSERQECKATARKMTGNDSLLDRPQFDKNPFANTASHTQGPSEQERVAGNDSHQRRQSERNGGCEDQYQRCTRACSAPAKPARGT
jgi:hypothetical protein